MKLNTRNQKTAYNATVGIISQVLVIFFNFISRTIFIHFLSSEYLGLNGLFANVLTILSFSELGIGEAMVYAMYKPMKNKNREKISALMNYYQKAYYIIAIIVGIIGFILSFFIENIISGKPNIPENLQFLFLLYLMNTVVSYLLSYKKSILFVDLKRYIVLYIQMIFTVIQIIFQFIVLYFYKNFALYYFIQIISTLGINLIVSFYVNKNYSWINNKNATLEKKDKDEISKNVKSLAVTKMAGVIGSGTDNIIASNILGLKIVGLASNYTLIINAINGLLWSLLSGIVNSIGDFNVNSTIDERRRIFDQLYLMSFIIFSICGSCIIALINPFIEVWIGKEYVISVWVAFALVLSIFIGGLNFSAYSFRISLGFFKQVKVFYIAYPLLNIFLSIIMGKECGITGIFLATSISRLLTAEIGDGYFVYKYGLNRRPINYFFMDFIYINIFLGLSLFLYFFVNLIPLVGIIGLIIKSICCFLLSIIIVLIISSRVQSFNSLKKRLFSLIVKENRV